MTNEPQKTNVESRFSASAQTYESHAHIQRTAANHLMTLLPDETSSLLEIGCGTGQLTRSLYRKYPDARFHILDVSADMVKECKLALPKEIDATWHVSNIESFESDERFPLIVSNSVLHWVEPLTQVLTKLRHISAPPAQLVCSIMTEGTLGELREVRSIVAPGKPPRREMPNREKTVARFESAGYDIVLEEEQTLVAHYPSTVAFLRAIHQMGVTGGTVSQSHQPLSRSELHALQNLYQERYEDPLRGVKASYKVLFLSVRAT